MLHLLLGVLHFSVVRVPAALLSLVARLLSLSLVFTFDYRGVIALTVLLSVGIYALVHRIYLTRYERLPPPALPTSKAAASGVSFDLHPDVSLDPDAGYGHDYGYGYDGLPRGTLSKTYAEEFLGSFLQSIRVFGYIEQPVFHELVRRLQTRKIPAGDILFSSATLSSSSSNSSSSQNAPTPQSSSSTTAGSTLMIPLISSSTPSSAPSPIYMAPSDHGQNHYSPTNTLFNASLSSQQLMLGAGGNAPEQCFFVVVEGCIQVFLRCDDSNASQFGDTIAPPSYSSSNSATAADSSLPGHRLLSEVHAGGTVSSLFAILSLLAATRTCSNTSDHTLRSQCASANNCSWCNGVFSNDVSINEHHSLSGASSETNSNKHSRNNSVNNNINGNPNADKAGNLNFVPQLPLLGITARASKDSTLVVIPAEAFLKLHDKYPHAASHIAQVILTRFQRATCTAMCSYLGLPDEILYLEKRIHDCFFSAPLPDCFFLPGGLERLRRKYGSHVLSNSLDSPPAQATVSANTTQASLSRPISCLNLPPAHGTDAVSPSSSMDAASQSPQGSEHSVSPPLSSKTTLDLTPFSQGSRSRASSVLDPRRVYELDMEETRMRRTVISCILHRIGLHGITEDASAAARRYSVPTTTEAFSRRVLGESPLGVSSQSHLKFEIDTSEVLFKFFSKGDVITQTGDLVDGLYFVIDGLVSVAIEKAQFFVRPGGLCGYMSALTGHPSLFKIEARTDVCISYLSKSALEKLVERQPVVMQTLVRRLISQMSPLIATIDFALEWMQVNAGQMLYRQSDPSESIFFILSGRLRSILESENGSFHLVEEHGQGDSVGEREVLLNTLRPYTTHAIRDTELARMPKALLHALSRRHPEISLAIARLIATRATTVAILHQQHQVQLQQQLISSTFTTSRANATTMVPRNSVENAGLSDFRRNNVNLKTVAILPVDRADLPAVTLFAEKLHDAFNFIGTSSILLDHPTVLRMLGKHAFSKMGKLKLLNWLAEQETRHSKVLYVASSAASTPWTQRCIRQADFILLVAVANRNPVIGEYERFLLGVKTTARKELVLLHPERTCQRGLTQSWLQNRLWIHGHHHVAMPSATTTAPDTSPGRTNANSDASTVGAVMASIGAGIGLFPLQNKTLETIRGHIAKRLRPTGPGKHVVPHHDLRSDFARLARHLSGKSVGLVLGGGGARGIAHIGVIRALEEAGVPVDLVGGTSFGALVGALYAREFKFVDLYLRAKSFCSRMSSLWRMLADVTLPLTAYITGHHFNRGVWKAFGDAHIEDLWLNYFCVTTNIVDSRMEVHQSGYVWRYVRASMSLSGFTPPLSDNGILLVDGGYLNNLPGDIMKDLGAKLVIMVDVAASDDTSRVHFGDALSGFRVLLSRINPFRKGRGIPTLAEIQSKLAYISCIKQLEEAKKLPGCYYLRPPVSEFSTFEFGSYDKIFKVGYEYGKQVVKDWERTGVIHQFTSKRTRATSRNSHVRRNSI